MNYFRTMLLLAAMTALFMAVGGMIGGQQGMMMAFMMAAVMNLIAWWNSDRMVLAHYNAKEVDERTAPNFYGIVRELATRANIPMPKVYIMQAAQPNAFATGRSPRHAAVCASSSLLQMLDHDEIMGVMGHELTHVLNRDTLTMTIAATLAGALANLAHMAMWMGIPRRQSNDEGRSINPIALIALMVLAPVAASLIQFAISRTREYAADRGGAALCGNPLALASALRKISGAGARIPMPAAESSPASAHIFISNPLRGGGMAALFATHPPMEQRIARLEAMAGQMVAAATPLPSAQTPIITRARGHWG